MMNLPYPSLPYLMGKPVASGQLRTEMADFKVFELLPFQPCGQGEHLLIHVRKTGANTVYVARQLAKYFGVKEALVSYAGLKDRFAVTEQWFGVHLPGKQQYDLSGLVIEGVEVLSYQRHNKKLKSGALVGNRFELTIQNLTGAEELSERFNAICQQGVPNYFGEQRFGIDGGNIARAEQLFAGTKVKDKKKRGIYLSAARSLLFNQIVAARIEQDCFSQLLPGDVCMLAGSQSVFHAEHIDEDLIRRLAEFDIDISASMWGAGQLMTTAKAAELELSAVSNRAEFCQGLGKFGLKQERRRIRLVPQQAKLSINNDVNGTSALVSFCLPAGSYATTVLRELLNYQDMTERANQDTSANVAS